MGFGRGVLFSVRSTSASDARIVVERSTAGVMSIAGEIDARSSGNSAITRSTASMMLAPGERYRMTRTDGLPLARPTLRKSSTESTTSPTSVRRTAAPLRYATISGRYSAAVLAWSLS
jgi:hypothetical protein